MKKQQQQQQQVIDLKHERAFVPDKFNKENFKPLNKL